MRQTLDTLVVVALLALGSTAASAATLVSSNPAPLTAEAARNWRPDERVRVGIDAMRESIVVSASLRPQGATDAVRLAQLGRAMEARVAGMIACCTQDDVGSRHLYALLVEMADGIALMQRAAHPDARRMGLLKVVQALNLYGTMFTHPGWRALDETLEVSAQ
ncbi:hypothetical protein [Aromatoleum petrolei]|uniref:DnrO protein n=1 Tax=Aromatoleum petrolei TaxID=76116 RepID=A0ABX1MU34_9RHOO|nr:hypothetical protein [Aromatoleum petrolei]NMF90745.1 hypothetical protein [Aromatoleum petrolei]QTQ38415.1 Uncharacterized protein ToN1_43160 [Aromatoleum petrolei]